MRNMKLTIIKNTCFSLLLLFIVVACENTPNNNSSNSKSVSASSSNTTSNSKYLYVSNSANIQQAELVLENNGNTKVIIGSETFFGEKKGDKLKYYDQQNNLSYEIKYKETSFKLRDHNSQLLWKVKQYDHKIKLSSNEEMNNAIEVKLKNDQKIVILRPGQDEQVVRIDAGKTPLKIGDQFLTTGFENNYHAGILLLDNLTPVEKYLLLAELNR